MPIGPPLVQILADKLSPRRAGEIGTRLFNALSEALAAGGDAVLAELQEILEEINAILGDATKPGGGGGGDTPIVELPGVPGRPGLSIQQIAQIAAQGGPAVREAIASLTAGVFTFAQLEDALPGIAAAVVAALERVGQAVPGGGQIISGTGTFSELDPANIPSGTTDTGEVVNTGTNVQVTVDLGGSVFNGSPEENGDAIAGAVEDILSEEQTVGAFNAGVS